MSSEKIFKLCQVETLAGAKLAAAARVNFIGLHAIFPTDFLFSQALIYKKIVDYLRDNKLNCKAVLVTRSDDIEFIVSVCKYTGISMVQLHAQFEHIKEGRQLLKEFKLQGLHVPQIVKNIVVNKDKSEEKEKNYPEELLHQKQDMAEQWSKITYAILFDASTKGGEGIENNWDIVAKVIPKVSHGRAWIAGGLNLANVLDALEKTKATGADAQSSLEIKRELKKKDNEDSRKIHYKNVDKVLKMVSKVKQIDTATLEWEYRFQRSKKAKVIFSPTEIEKVDEQQIMDLLLYEDLDGIQIDAADKTIGVDPWPVPADEWAERIWDYLPEMPLFIHFFSKNDDWIKSTAKKVMEKNLHTVCFAIQTHKDVRQTHQMCLDLEKEFHAPVILSVTSGQAYRLKEDIEAIMPERRLWQITCPSQEKRRVEKISQAIQMFRKGDDNWLYLDRGVTLSLLKKLKEMPDTIIIGRALLESDENGTLETKLHIINHLIGNNDE